MLAITLQFTVKRNIINPGALTRFLLSILIKETQVLWHLYPMRNDFNDRLN